jgi:hypothetical protein
MTTVGLPDTSTQTIKELVSCLVVSSACAYGPQDGSSSSSLTSTNVS